MRSARTLLAGAALAATVTLAVPAVAHADAGAPGGRDTYSEDRGPTDDGYGSDDDWKSHRRDDGQDKGREGGWQGSTKGREDHEGHRGREGRWHGGWKHHDRPHGGVHTGGGGMAASGGGMAAGGVLLLGGLGAGAYVLRRRSSGSRAANTA